MKVYGVSFHEELMELCYFPLSTAHSISILSLIPFAQQLGQKNGTLLAVILLLSELKAANVNLQ